MCKMGWFAIVATHLLLLGILIQSNNWLGKNTREEVLFFRLLPNRQQFATTTGILVGEQGKPASVRVAEKWGKRAGGLVPPNHKRWLQVAPKSKITEYGEKTHELAIQEELAKEILKTCGEISLKIKSHLERLKSYYKAVEKGQRLGKYPTGEDIFLRLLTKRRGFAKTTGKHAREQVKPISSKSPLEQFKSKNETLQRDHWLGKNPAEFVRLLIKRRGFAKTTGKLAGDQGKHTSHTMVEEFEKPQHVSSLNRHHRESGHSLQKRSILHLPTELPSLTSSIIVEDHGNDEVSKNIIGLFMYVIKKHCKEHAIQICPVVRIMKEIIQLAVTERLSALRKFYLLPPKNVIHIPTASSRKMEKPSDEPARKGIPQYGKVYLIYLLLAFSVTIFVMLIIILIILSIQSRSHQTAKGMEGTSLEKRTLLDRMERGTLEKQTSAASFQKPLWLEDMYQPVNEISTKDMIDKLHDQESSENIYSWANARPPVIPEFITVEKLDLMPPAAPAPLNMAPSEASAPAPAPALSLAPAPAPAPEPIKKASSKKLSEKESPASETSPNVESEKETPTSETSPKTESSGEGEEDEED